LHELPSCFHEFHQLTCAQALFEACFKNGGRLDTPLIVLKFPASHQRHDEKETARSKTCKLDVKAFLVLFRQENVTVTFFGMSNFCNDSNNAQFQN